MDRVSSLERVGSTSGEPVSTGYQTAKELHMPLYFTWPICFSLGVDDNLKPLCVYIRTGQIRNIL